MLPKNPTADDYQKYYETLTPDQQQQFRKAGLLRVINTIYTDGAEEVIEDSEPEGGTITSGRFIDKRPTGNREFRFKLLNEELVFQPLNPQAIGE